MANHLARDLPRLVGTGTPFLSGVLRTSSGRISPLRVLLFGGNSRQGGQGGSGCCLYPNVSLGGWRFKSSGGSLTLGKSSRRKTDAAVKLYQTLDFAGAPIKKLKPKPKAQAFPPSVKLHHQNNNPILKKCKGSNNKHTPILALATSIPSTKAPKGTGSFLKSTGCPKKTCKETGAAPSTCVKKNKLLGTNTGNAATKVQIGGKAKSKFKNERNALFSNGLESSLLSTPKSSCYKYESENKSQIVDGDVMDADMYFQSEYLQSRKLLSAMDTQGISVETLDSNVPAADKWTPVEAWWINNGFQVEPPSGSKPSPQTGVDGTTLKSSKRGPSTTLESGKNFGKVVKGEKERNEEMSSSGITEYGHLLYDEKRHRQKDGGGVIAACGKSDPKKHNPNESLKRTNAKGRETVADVAKRNGDVSSNRFVLVDKVVEKNYTVATRSKGDKSPETPQRFSTEVDALIKTLKIDGWESSVQKSLLDASRKSTSTSFILVDSSPTSNQPENFSFNPAKEDNSKKGNDVANSIDLGKTTSTHKSDSPSQKNVSSVPNNTAQLPESVQIIGHLKPKISTKGSPPPTTPTTTTTTTTTTTNTTNNTNKTRRSKERNQATRSNSEPVLSVKPSEIKNRKKENSRQNEKKGDIFQGPLSKSSVKSSASFCDLANKIINSADMTRLNSDLRAQSLETSTKRRKEIWSSSDLLALKKAKRKKEQENKESKDGVLTGSSTDNVKVAKSGNVAGKEDKQKEARVEKLRQELKQEFKNGFLEMQRENFAKAKPSSTLVHTPNNFAKWMESSEGRANIKKKEGLTKPSNNNCQSKSGKDDGRKEEKKMSKSVVEKRRPRDKNEKGKASKNKENKKLDKKADTEMLGLDKENGKLGNSFNDEVVVRLALSGIGNDLTSEQEKIVRNITSNIRDSLKELRRVNREYNPRKTRSTSDKISRGKDATRNLSGRNATTYYVLSDDGEPFETYANQKDEQYFAETSKSNESWTSTTAGMELFPLVDVSRLDGFMTMTLTPVHDPPATKQKSVSQPFGYPTSAVSDSDSTEKQRLARNMEALRRYQDRQDKEKEDKRKRKKKLVRQSGSTDVRERSQKSSTRKSKNS